MTETPTSAKKYHTAEQVAAIKLLESLHAQKIMKRATLRTEIEAVLQDRLTSLELKESQAANDALRLGVSKTAVGRALGTANWGTINATLARTAGDTTAADLYRDPLDERYTFDTASRELTVTLTADETARGVTVYGWTEAAAAGLDLSRATFDLRRRGDGSQYLDPVTELATAERGWFMHPAVCWVTRNKDHEAEALAYAQAHADQATN